MQIISSIIRGYPWLKANCFIVSFKIDTLLKFTLAKFQFVSVMMSKRGRERGLSGAERAKRAEPHLTRRILGGTPKKWSKKLLWRAKRALEKMKL